MDTTEPVETLPVAEAPAQLREAERRRGEATARMSLAVHLVSPFHISASKQCCRRLHEVFAVGACAIEVAHFKSSGDITGSDRSIELPGESKAWTRMQPSPKCGAWFRPRGTRTA